MIIGVCKIDENRKIVELKRGPLRQGWGFKNPDAFEHSPKLLVMYQNFLILHIPKKIFLKCVMVRNLLLGRFFTNLISNFLRRYLMKNYQVNSM